MESILTKQSHFLISSIFGKVDSFYKKCKLPIEKEFNHEKNRDTIHILSKLYQDLQNGEKLLKHTHIEKDNIIITSVNQIPKPKTFPANSFPKDIRIHIDATTHSFVVYSFSLLERIIQVYFIVEDTSISFAEFDQYIQRIILLLNMVVSNANSTADRCAKSLDIFIYMTSREKMLPLSNVSILDEMHVNTAFSYSCRKKSEIVVFRKEEWFKTLIHECFHVFGLEFSNTSIPYNKEILSVFPIPVPVEQINYFETYAEIWARILNICFCSIFDGRGNMYSLATFLQHFNIMIHFEQIYSCFQMVKVLDFMGLTYKDLYSLDKKSVLARDILYKENTSVFSYHVLTCILLQNYGEFMNWCNTHNFSLFHFEITRKNIKEFTDLIRKNYKSKTLNDMIKCLQDALVKYKHGGMTHSDNDYYLLNNTRMSICELK
jgi:hypothetical protein